MLPQFFVLARVVGSEGSFVKWQERLVPLCDVSATEPQGTTYYWAVDIDGSEPDTLWGLEGYSHAVGFFLGHPSSDVFKHEMSLVDGQKLLKHEQGLTSRDYDLHHYDFESGYLKIDSDDERDSKTGHVALEHFWAKEGKRKEMMALMGEFAESVKGAQTPGKVEVQSCAVLKECVYKHGNLATLWVRTKTPESYKTFRSSKQYLNLKKKLEQMLANTELHQARAFNGHIDLKPKF